MFSYYIVIIKNLVLKNFNKGHGFKIYLNFFKIIHSILIEEK